MVARSDLSWEDAKASGQFVFICHSREDKRRIARSGLIRELARLRIHVVIDNAYSGLMPDEEELQNYIHQIKVGSSWKTSINEFARSAGCILLLLSTTLFDRLRNKRGKYEWCIAEMRIGANAEKLMPVSIEEHLRVDYTLINSLVESAIEPDQEVGLAAGDPDSRDGALAKLYESICEIFEIRFAARSEALARDRDAISPVGKQILLDLMARDGHCQSIANAPTGIAVTYCDPQGSPHFLCDSILPFPLGEKVSLTKRFAAGDDEGGCTAA